MTSENSYKYLERRPGSAYKQLFTKGRKIRAIVLYSLTRGEDAMTPEEVAKDYDLPVEMVREAIDYCEKNPDILRQDVEMEDKTLREHWKTNPPIVPPGFVIPES